MATDTVYLDSQDELSSIRFKLDAARGPAILVVAPRSVRLLRDPLQMKLLRRCAESLGKQIALVAEDGYVRRLAREEGIVAFRSLKSVNERAFGLPERGADDLPPRLTPVREIQHIGPVGWAIRGVALAAIAIFFILALLMTPQTTVVIIPDTQEVAETLTITATTRIRSASPAELRVPGRRIETTLDTYERAKPTQKVVKGDKPATGQVTITNNGTTAVNLPRGFQVQSVDNKRFALTTDVVIQVGQRAAQTVPIQALEPGTAGNVPSFAINRAVDPTWASRLVVTNNNPITGGTDIEVPVVSEEDRQKLRERVLQKLRQQALAELANKRYKDESFFNDTVTFEVVSEVFDKKPGEEAVEFGLTMKIYASALAFSGPEVNAVSLRRLETTLRPGFQLARDTLYTKPVGLETWDRDSVTFYLDAEVKAIPRLDEAQLKQALLGRTPDEARAYLASTLRLAREPEIAVSPNWFGRLSLFPWRIDLRVIPLS
jgi:hypothetical protein